MSQNVDENEEYELPEKDNNNRNDGKKQEESSLNESNTLTQLEATLVDTTAINNSNNHKNKKLSISENNDENNRIKFSKTVHRDNSESNYNKIQTFYKNVPESTNLLHQNSSDNSDKLAQYQQHQQMQQNQVSNKAINNKKSKYQKKRHFDNRLSKHVNS